MLESLSMENKRAFSSGLGAWGTYLLLAVVAAAGATALSAFTPTAVPVAFWGNDCLCKPGRIVRVEARVHASRAKAEQNPGVEGIPVSLLLDGRFIRKGITDRDGVAIFFLRAPARAGHFRYTVALGACYGHQASALDVHAMDPGTSFVVLDIDGLLVQGGPAALRSSPVRAAAQPGTVEGVGRLAERFGIIYFSREQEVFTAPVRRWLQTRGFPPGLVVLRGDTVRLLSRSAFCKLRLDELSYFWHHDWFAVLSDERDAKALGSTRIRGILVGDGSKEVTPRTQRVVTFDDAVRTILDTTTR
jgi:hypothetical protein